MGEESAGSEKLGLAHRVLQIFGVLHEGSSTGFLVLVCETFHRIFLQNPKGSAEFWGGGGSPDPSFANRRLFLLHLSQFLFAMGGASSCILSCLFGFVLSLGCSSYIFQQWPHLIIPKKADSRLVCEPVYKPHVGH